MASVLKLFIPDSTVEMSVRRLTTFLNISIDYVPNVPLEADIYPPIFEIRSDAPLRLGAILDWIHLRSTDQHHSYKGVPDCFKVRFGSLSLRHKYFMPPVGEPVRLTDRECDFLGALYCAEGHVMTKSDLLDLVWGYAAGVETHTVETHLYRLRQKIERDAGAPENIITTDRGYQLIIA